MNLKSDEKIAISQQDWVSTKQRAVKNVKEMPNFFK